MNNIIIYNFLGDRRITHSISKLQNNSSKSVDNVVIRKLEFDQLNGDTVNTSIANNSISRRRSSSHRNSSSFNEKSSYQSLSSLASGSEAEDDTEIEVKNFLRQSYDQLDKTIALRSRHHLLHHQDYVSIKNQLNLSRFIYSNKDIKSINKNYSIDKNETVENTENGVKIYDLTIEQNGKFKGKLFYGAFKLLIPIVCIAFTYAFLSYSSLFKTFH